MGRITSPTLSATDARPRVASTGTGQGQTSPTRQVRCNCARPRRQAVADGAYPRGGYAPDLARQTSVQIDEAMLTGLSDAQRSTSFTPQTKTDIIK